MRLFVYFFSAVFVLCFFVLPARAATYIVTNTNNDGAGSLRAAINTANSTPDDDTINFNIPGCENGGCTIGFSGGLGTTALIILPAGKLTIANKPNASNITINANGTDRVFIVTGGANLTLNGFNITGGNSNTFFDPSYCGGGIYNNGGTVTLINSAVSGNFSGDFNGGAAGITNQGSLTLTNSSVFSNTSKNSGIFNTGTAVFTNSSISASSGNAFISITGSVTADGLTISGNRTAILNQADSTITLTNSVISDHTDLEDYPVINYGNLTLLSTTYRNNKLPIITYEGILSVISSNIRNNGDPKLTFAGGIINWIPSAQTVIVNSTINNNTGTSAGGIFNLAGILDLVNSTITRNNGTSDLASGIYDVGGSISFRNTIVADNAGVQQNTDFFNDGGASTSYGNNLIGNTDNTDTAWQSSDILNQSPRLAPLGNYGGATQSVPLTNNSPAVNAGNNCVIALNGCGDNNPALPTDQRGAARVGSVDIGAFEINNTANGGTFRAVTTTGQVTLPFSYQLTPDSGNFTYSVTAGTLPTGLSLSNSFSQLYAKNSRAPQAGAYSITGTPTMGGTFNYTITATDGTNSVSTDYTTTIQAAPTAANVSIGGRVLTASGRGISGAIVTLTDAGGNTRSARTNSFGYYRFNDVAAGATCVFQARHKRYEFAPQILSVAEEINNLNFTASQ